jgi:hypothetical protein
MATANDVLTQGGLVNVSSLVTAAGRIGLPLHIAAAFAEQESGGQNIYGHDAGGVFAKPPGVNVAVTKENYAEFFQKVVVQGKRSNGVGPMQITYPGYFPLADKQKLRLWMPLDNYLFGLGVISGFLATSYTDTSINRAGQRYNSGSPTGAPDYGSSVVKRATRWRTRLAAVTTNNLLGGGSLKLGSTGPRVRALQVGLNRFFPLYSHLVITGVFDAPTQKVVKEFQRRTGLPRDGVVDPVTRDTLASFGIVL